MRQVRCFMGDNEERWFMWYSGRGSGDPSLDAIAPAAGSIGPLFPASNHPAGAPLLHACRRKMAGMPSPHLVLHNLGL